MKQYHKRNEANFFIKYNNNVPTSKITLTILVAIMFVFGMEMTNIWLDNFIAQSNLEIAGMHLVAEAKASEIEKDYVESDRQEFLSELRNCESSGNNFAKGDSGASIGSYQWQKPTLEDYLGRKLSYDEYYSIVTNYEKIHPITYDTYFEKKESWRWKNCTIKINKQKAWKI